ncbi:MAG: hypothetical protein K2J44_06335 [Ruminococcus sp.]|nr:hypothetical protein [Ruminococcus sp.]
MTCNANLELSIDSLIDDINVKFGDIKSSVSADFTRLIAVIESEFRKTDNILSQILGAVNSLPDKFGELLKYLFIPQEEHFTHLIDEINKHFGFIHQIIKLGDVLVNESDFNDFQPSYSIGFDSDTYGHFKTEIIDFSVVAPYVDIIKGINTGIILYFFIRRTRRKLPDIINGTGGD